MDTERGSPAGMVCLLRRETNVDDQEFGLARELAEAIEVPLVVRSASRRGGREPAAGAALLVARGAQGALSGLLAPDRSPTLSKRLGIPAVLVPERSRAPLRSLTEGEIVCGVDGSRAARAAADAASALAERLSVPMALVHAQAPIPSAVLAPAGGGLAGLPIEELEQQSRDAGWKILDDLDKQTVQPARLRLRSGLPARCLNDYASWREAPMIVVGAPRSGPLASLLIQSTAWELSRHATVPVMYVPEGSSPAW